MSEDTPSALEAAREVDSLERVGWAGPVRPIDLDGPKPEAFYIFRLA